MKKIILAVSSSGGHWEQMMLLRSAFSENDVVYANTLRGLSELSGVGQSYIIDDCNRDTPVRNFRTAWQIARIIAKHRPDVIVSTGAAPGLIAIAIGRLFCAKTVWIDSIANSEKLSMSGKLAGYVAHLHLTQWEHLAYDNGPRYAGKVL